ncbi:Heterokaryon incompatibility s-like protein [Cladobotryum mycophilum]|uniref:Heterokaryon incompatibility s-like protein n=1 Tax=Cladobotryum mycophilum TaxID=491253 RepID=A0ABR0S811_9HYPO
MDMAVNAISLLNFALECLDRIQLAREFEDDFATYQLKLDVVQIRLSRWGEVAGVTVSNGKNNEQGPQLTGNKPTQDPQGTQGVQGGAAEADTIKKAEEILGEIQDTIFKAQRDAKRMRTNLDMSSEQPIDPDISVPSDLKKIRARLRECLRKRRARAATAADSLKWAFYKRAHFDKFVRDISALISDLENLFPKDTQEKLAELSGEECKGIGKSNLEELKDVAQDCDPWLEKAAEETLINSSRAGTYITQSHNSGLVTGIHHGDVKGVSIGNNNKTSNNWGRS